MGPQRKRHFAQRGDEGAQSSKKAKITAESTPGVSGDAQALALQAQLMAELEQANALLAKQKGFANTGGDAKGKPSARSIKMDSAGNLIDEQGNILETGSSKPGASMNSGASSKNRDKASRQNQKKDNEAKQREEAAKSNPYLAHLESGSGRKGGKGSKGGGRAVGGIRQPTRALKFFQPGEYAKSAVAASASVISAPTTNSKSKSDVSPSVSGKSGLRMLPRAAITSSSNGGIAGATTEKAIPRMEWWDNQYLPKDRQRGGAGSKKGDYVADEADLQLSNCVSYKYVEHPVPIPSLSRLKAEQTLPMYLTKQERARIRKKKRGEAEQERRDKEAMGLVPPREPKLKLSNFMRVLGEKAVLDPSKMEMSVLQQIYRRKATHELNNAKNKLTDEQRKEKTWLKRQDRETTASVESLHVAVFCVGDVGGLDTQIKIRRNAQEWFLTGALVRCLEVDTTSKLGKNLVIVEGGPRGVSKFSRLMLERINWSKVVSSSSSSSSSSFSSSSEEKEEDNMVTGEKDGQGEGNSAGGRKQLVTMDVESDKEDQQEDSDSDSAGESGDAANQCQLLWKGLASKRAFTRFLAHETKSAAGARHWLDTHRLVHFWHIAQEPSQ